jgi:hypothetical protein
VFLGITLVAVGIGLLALGKPNAELPPRFLRSPTASEMYAVLIVTVIALGIASIFDWLVNRLI